MRQLKSRWFGWLGQAGVLASVLIPWPIAVAAAEQPIQVNNVAAGAATFTTQGSHTTIQAADRTIINYNRFDIPAGSAVQFVQPSASSTVLNRIQSVTPSRIDGSLSANGIVYLVNPSGVMFGPGSVVNVAQLFAAGGHITDADFLNGVKRFVTGEGSVINEGTIHASDGASLIGSIVKNIGAIYSPQGVVTLASGKEVYLQQQGSQLMVRVDGLDGATGKSTAAPGSSADNSPGVANSGTVSGKDVFFTVGDVYSLALVNSGSVSAPGGNVTMAGKGRVENSGSIDVSNTTPGAKGGNAKLLGNTVTVSGSIDASGDTGGGKINVGGEFQGGDALAGSQVTHIRTTGSLKADALTSGDGGRIIVWSDGSTGYFGDLSAKGGVTGGNGGFAEISGHHNLAIDGQINLSALAGHNGWLLLDPKNIIVNGSGGTPITADRQFTDNPSGTETFLNTTIKSLLNGANLTLQANNDITINAAILAADNGSDGNLTLEAGRSIFINASIALRGFFEATANIELNSGAQAAQRDSGVAVFTMASGTSISSTNAGGGVDIRMGRGNFGANNQGGLITLRDINVGSNELVVDNEGGLSTSGITLNGNIVASGSGFMEFNAFFNPADITINGTFSLDTGELNIQAGNDVIFGSSSSITGVAPRVEINSGNISDTAGAITMADGSIIDVGSGNVRLRSVTDVTLGRIVSNNNFDRAIEIRSRLGAIKDGGDTGGPDLQAAIGGVAIYAHSIGALTNPIEVAAGTLETSTRVANGNQFINLTVGSLNNGFYLNAGTGNITLNALSNLADKDGLLDLVASTATINITGGNLGSATDLINIAVNTPNFSGVTGSVFVNSAITNVNFTSGFSSTTPGDQFVLETTGTLTINAAINLSGNNSLVKLGSSGNLIINQPVTVSGQDSTITVRSGASVTLNSSLINLATFTGSSNPIEIFAEQNINLSSSAVISTLAGNQLTINADSAHRENGSAGAIFMADGSAINGGTAEVSLRADQDITVAAISSSGISVTGEDITLRSTSGAIVDGGDTGGANLSAPSGGVQIEARNGVGNGNAIETEVANLQAVSFNGTGTINVNELDDVSIKQLINFNPSGGAAVTADGIVIESDNNPLQFSGGQVSFAASNNITINQLIMGASTLIIHAGVDGAGNLTFGSPRIFLGADTILLRAGDGVGGGTGSLVNAVTNNPFFGGTANGSKVQSFTIRQDASLTAPLGANFNGGVDGSSLTFQSDQGTVTVSTAPQLGKPQLHVIGGVDVLLNVGLDVQTLDVSAGSGGISILGQIIPDGNVTVDSIGDIILDAGIIKTNGTNNTVRLNSNGNINIGNGADILANGTGKLDVILNSDRDISGAGAITVGNGSAITTKGGDITLGGGTSPTNSSAAGGTLPVGVSLNGVQFDSAGGNISIRGLGGSTGAAPHAGVFIQGSSSIQSGAGTLVIVGDGGTAAFVNPGIELVSSTLQSTTGLIQITGAAGTGTNNSGLEITSSTVQTTSGGSITIGGVNANGAGRAAADIANSLIQTSGNGHITITGDASSGVGFGANLSGNLIKTINGTVSLTGTGGNASGTSNNGVVMQLFGVNPNVIQTTTGIIDIFGTGGVGDFSNGVRVLSSTIESLGSGVIFLSGSGRNATGASGSSTGINLVAGTVRTVNGDISISGNGALGPNGFNHGILTQASSLIESSGSGAITLFGAGGTTTGATGGSNVGVDLDSATIRTTATSSGAISITGTGAATAVENNGRGIQFGPAGTLVTSLGTGTITLLGTGGNGNDEGQGVVIQNAGSQVLSVNGNISITGSGNGSGNICIGVFILDNATVQSNGPATIFIDGTSAVGASGSHGVAVTNNGKVLANNSSITIQAVTSGGLTGSSAVFLQDGVVQASGSGSVGITGSGGGAGRLEISLQGSSIVGSSTSTGSLTLNGNFMNFTATSILDGTGNLLIQPTGISTSIGINDTGTLQLTASSLSAISNGFNSITFGRADGQHVINIGSATFTDPVIFRAPVAPGHIFVNGTLTGSGNASFTFNGSGATTTLGGDILTAGNPVSFNDSVVLTNDVTINTANGVPAGADVTFGNKVNGTAGTEDLTIKTGATGDLAFNNTVGQTQPLGDVVVIETNNLTAAGDFRASSVTETSGHGETQFGGELRTTGAGGVNLTGNTFRFEDDVVTTGGGGFTLNNSGNAVITPGFALELDGALNQTGPGSTFNGRSITTTGDSVSFTGPLTITADITINTTTGGNTGGADISFLGPVNSNSGNQDLNLNAGTLGDILFGSTVGQTQPLGDTNISNAHDVTGLAFIGSHTFTQQAGTGDTNLTNVNTDSSTVSIKGQTETAGKLITVNQSNFASEVAGVVMFAGGSEGGEARELDAQTAQALGLPAGAKANPIIAQRLADRLQEMSARTDALKTGLAQLVAGGENPAQWARSVSPQNPLFQQLSEVNEALDMVNLLGLSPQDAQTARTSIMDRFRPEGMSNEQMQSLLNAVRARGLVVSGAGNE